MTDDEIKSAIGRDLAILSLYGQTKFSLMLYQQGRRIATLLLRKLYQARKERDYYKLCSEVTTRALELMTEERNHYREAYHSHNGDKTEIIISNLKEGDCIGAVGNNLEIYAKNKNGDFTQICDTKTVDDFQTPDIVEGRQVVWHIR